MPVQFTGEQPVYNPDRRTIRFVGWADGRHVDFQITEEAVLHLGKRNAVLCDIEVLEIFAAHRSEIEAVASLKHANGAARGDTLVTVTDTERYRAQAQKA